MTRNLLLCSLFVFPKKRLYCLLLTSLFGFLFGLYVSSVRPVFREGNSFRMMPTEFPSTKDTLRHTDLYRNGNGHEPAVTKRVGVKKKRQSGRRMSNNTKVLRGIVNRLVYPNAANRQIRRSLLNHLENCFRNSSVKFNATQLTISELTRLRITEYLTQRGYRQRLPDVINIGVKKSGTTLLSWFMAHHPGIAHAKDVETHFFDRYFQLGLQYYKSRMTFASDDQLSFEKTPRYFVNPETPRLIRELLPRHVRFIINVRDPIERAISDFRHISEVNLSNGGKINASLTKNRTSITEGLRFTSEVMSPLNGSVFKNHTVIDTSIYAKHMERWLQYFPLAKFHFVDHAQLMINPSSEMNKIERFLNLTTFYNPEMFNGNAKNIMLCTKGHCMAHIRSHVIPKATPDERTISKLKLFFEPHNQYFSTLIGREFSWS
ncbi:heparan sulfate glucosamine 3-O-sulfotransferase 5-like [Asterias rubens]|uniref:heparan sulfate glucosamine 3-O-sulfotransferase 5-like n=1 Tax=Asterias rubens TaxID=7604 RepID=UPI0014550DEE|nr:heparan sulfate glucosamine 3-O-sulfotransferase 5-like [Asterias rubens]